MATTKKKPAAKSVTSKKTVKAPVTRKAAPKKTAPKKQSAEVRSFRPAAEKIPFMTFDFTIQTVYWMIFGVLVLALGAWVMHLNVKIQTMYDQVEMNTYLHEKYTLPQNTDKAAPTE